MTNLKNFSYFIITLLFIFSIEAKEQIITVCEVTKTAYAHIRTDSFTDLAYDDKPTGETYTLLHVDSNTFDQTLSDMNNYNISYKSIKYPMINWNAVTMLNKDNGKANILNWTPLIIRLVVPDVQEEIYYFNIDNLGIGTMTKVSTRYNHPFINNQSLYFAVCKKE